jgi:guanylate kinase
MTKARERPDSKEDAHEVRRRGLMLVLSSPSGAGKTTISRKLLGRDGNLSMSISVTTRQRRGPAKSTAGLSFHRRERIRPVSVGASALLEHAKVLGNYYGTPREAVNRPLSEGRDVLFDIDWQGTQQLAEKLAKTW